MKLSTLLDSITPTSPNWEWSWRDMENSPAVELRGVFKGKTKAIIRIALSYSLLETNKPQALKLIKKTVDKAESASVYIDTPLFKAMEEK